ncbi:4-coumarate--CoA ligase family protein [Mycolicibacterium sp. P9-64]|uniref:AMP-binding protein n=1 Tax=Mycolicibacterium sp. P9-64 TaxID=2024612 RepID=UPI0011ED7CA6|nr:AMP-binding protein [Mycolicibacterium sp. P9-64]KAA0084178.1 4-coumarate--CoA ligase family protein [Mycolicibacterium sp. P9-64]
MCFTSPFPDVVIPDLEVFDYLFGDISPADLERVALVDAKTCRETTYRELIDGIEAFAAKLSSLGIGVGDVVGLLSPNSTDFAVAFHGILRAGATATPVNALSTAEEIARQLGDSRATMVITVAALRDRAEAAAAAVGLPASKVILLDGEALRPQSSGRRAVDPRFRPETHLAVLPYSSGTTGLPKGVMLTHRNLVANAAQVQPLKILGADDVIIAVLPFFHIYGLSVLLTAALVARAKLVIMPSFDLEAFLAAIQDHRCTRAFIVPPLALALANHPVVTSYDLSSLGVIVCGAAPLDAELNRTVNARLGVTVLQGFGMSELSGVGHGMPVDGGRDSLGVVAQPDSCGWTLPNAVSKIVSPETGVEIAVPDRGRSAAGELCFSGPNVMVGYLGNAEATADTIDADGFLHTGDLACVDETGCVYIIDRLKELIKYKGYQVAPAELEALLLTHPGIADAAVVGVNDPKFGEEIPKAFVVPKPSVHLSAAEVMEFVARNVAPYKKIRDVQFIETIPKSPAGKILRKALRER